MVTRKTFAVGSFGLRPKDSFRADGRLVPNTDQIMDVWFCGRQKVGQVGVNAICAHRTRAEARACEKRSR